VQCYSTSSTYWQKLFRIWCALIIGHGLLQGWPTNQRPRATFLTVLPQRATSYTWAHMNITRSLPHSRTYLYSARFTVNITHQHDNDRTLQAIYCYACCLMGILVITEEPHETAQRAAYGSRAAGWPPLVYWIHRECTLCIWTLLILFERETRQECFHNFFSINFYCMHAMSLLPEHGWPQVGGAQPFLAQSLLCK